MKNIIYRDKLVEITDVSITLNKFYFPTLSPKVIAFRDIEKIEVRKPTIWSGKWRIHGTGNFRTWYPYDSSRPGRDKIFIIRYRNKWIQSGFTVEKSAEVESILRAKKLVK